MAKKLEWLRKPILIACLAIAAGHGVAATLWVDDKSNNLYTVDTGAGTALVIGKMDVGNTQITDIAFDNTGRLWGITFDSLYRIDPTTAAVERIGSLGGSSFTSLVFGNGKLYAADQSPGQLYIIDTVTGLASSQNTNPTSVPDLSCANVSQSSVNCPNLTPPAFSSSGDLAFVGGTLYLSSVNAAGADTLVTLGYGANEFNGTVTKTVGSLGQEQVYGLATDGASFYAAAGHAIYSVGANGLLGSAVTYTTGLDKFGNTVTLDVANGATYYDGQVAGVPEPSTYAMLLAGLGVMGLLARRRLPRSTR